MFVVKESGILVYIVMLVVIFLNKIVVMKGYGVKVFFSGIIVVER